MVNQKILTTKTGLTSKVLTGGAEQPGSMTSGGGGGAGKVNFNDLTVVAAIDKAAPTILKNCATGQHLSKVEISVCKAGGEQIEYSRTTLEDVLVTGVKFIGVQDNDALKNALFIPSCKSEKPILGTNR